MPDADVNYKLTGPNLGGTVTWVASPTMVNEVVFGYGLWTENQVYRDAWLAEVQRDKLGINLPQIYPDQNPLKLIPSLAFGSTNIGTSQALSSAVHASRPGDHVQVGWTDQNGQHHSAGVTLAGQSAPAA